MGGGGPSFLKTAAAGTTPREAAGEENSAKMTRVTALTGQSRLLKEDLPTKGRGES